MILLYLLSLGGLFFSLYSLIRGKILLAFLFFLVFIFAAATIANPIFVGPLAISVLLLYSASER